ncbi:NIPSNAP family protein [Hyphococcus lacteus]|uniref:NIPSNAP family protein n=1 Tax=Hyphococcus lacteus TaxID=3143536 RepID=A0ABV3ZBI0_9PROT
MKIMPTAGLAFAALCCISSPAFASQTAETRGKTCIYEMRTYYAADGKLEELHSRFREHTLRIFAKHGIESVGYWVPEENSKNTLIYILTYPDKHSRTNSWAAFRADPEWQSVAEKSEENGKLVERVDSTFLYNTDYSPMKCSE